MATVVGRSPPDGTEAVVSPSVSRLLTPDADEKEHSRSREVSRDFEKGEDGEHRESIAERESTTHNESVELRPSEILRVGTEIDTFINRGRQASVATVRLRPQLTRGDSYLPPEDPPEKPGPLLYDVVTHAVTRKNEGKQIPIGDTHDWVEPFISGDPGAATSAHVNVARLSMSVAFAKAKLDGISSKVLAKHGMGEDGAVGEHGNEVSPRSKGVVPVVIVSPSSSAHSSSSASASSTSSSSAASVSPSSASCSSAATHSSSPSHATGETPGLPKQASLHLDDAESAALNKQRQNTSPSMPMRKELMTTRRSDVTTGGGTTHDTKDTGDDDDANRKVRILLPAKFAPAELASPPAPTKTANKAILKPSPFVHNGLATLQRQEAYIARMMDSRMKVAYKFMKYNMQGKPNSRYFYITEDGTELHWTKTNPAKGRNKQALTAEKPRKRFFADVRGVYYGPYNNRRVFRRFLDNKDQFEGSGKDWLCITVAFDDRTLDFCCTTDEEVSTWFLCMQALAPLAASYLTCGSVLWRRLIMKLNAYGLNPDRWPGPLPETTEQKKGATGKKK